jgi:signal transduction histidine kinase/DNA-binding response OmpR family regulator/HAMP domain-containing protein
MDLPQRRESAGDVTMTDMHFGPGVLDRRELLKALRALKRGDFSVRLPADLVGMDGEIAQAFNDVVEASDSLTEEFARIRDAVGREGRIAQRVRAPAATGRWAESAESVNALISDLVQPLSDVARVIESVAKGDLSQTMLLESDGHALRGEFLRIGKMVNTMVGQLGAFASEVSRVAREVGTEGKLGGQARVHGIGGTWKDITDNVNAMAANLTGQVRNIAEVTTAVARGDLSKKITVDVRGEILELKSTINTMVDQLNAFASEVSRVAREVGTEGKLGGQARVQGIGGTWKDLTDNVNQMAANLTGQVRNIAEVTTAVARGDLSKKITVDVKGEILELKSTINTMVDQLNAFASEVSRVAREVGTEGKLGGQAQVPGIGGTWKDLTDNVNQMAANLTGQVRGIAQIVTAVAQGDLKRKVSFETKGEIAALADTINNMIDTLATFGAQVTSVAREVGVEGKLGGQAKVPGAAGLWRALTDNVNQLAANLTTQVRAIAEVATAVTKGDLTRSIMVEAQGEVAALKDNINEMIRNLRDTVSKNTEQDWLKTHLARFTRLLQGHRDVVAVSKLVLSELAPLVNAQQGVVYLRTVRGTEASLQLLASYAHRPGKAAPRLLRMGEGLIGQCALEKKRILLDDVPPDYVKIGSALGAAVPRSLIILPILFEGHVKAVLELASIGRFTSAHLSFLDQLAEIIGIVFNSIEAGMRTEDLLKQSQSLTSELQFQQQELRSTNERLAQQALNLQQSQALLRQQQEELKGTNEELQEKARLLSEQMEQVEHKNREVEQARAALEEKAEQLALSSRYKSEFLANMSHELRTPLNSLLILARLLQDNAPGNLNPKQIEYAQTIHAAGADLLLIINDILDLAKIESGTVTLSISQERFSETADYVERSFRQMANEKKLHFDVAVDTDLPDAILTDTKRLQQILKNLLSNAFKFTEHGSVLLRIEPATAGWTQEHPQLRNAEQVVAFSVIDTGIGIPANKQRIIFEAFQQADGTTSRQYGGTGLGLSISRELARLLGGEIQVSSAPGKGSTFTLYLPLSHRPVPGRLAAEAPASAPKPLNPAYVDPGARAEALSASRITEPRAAIRDDRQDIQPGDRVVLIIEDDPKFASVLLDLVRDSGFKGVVALDARTALVLVKEVLPDAITLDLRLPDMDGWAVLDLLKHDPEVRHIPVNVISVADHIHRCFHMGALGVVQKPAAKAALQEALIRTRQFIEREVKTVLVAHGGDEGRSALVEALRSDRIEVAETGSGQEALETLQRHRYDCIVVGPELRDMSAVDLLKKFARTERAAEVPIVMHGAASFDRTERDSLRELSEVIVLKNVKTPEAVLEQTTLFLHQAVNALPEKKRRLLDESKQSAGELSGKKVLIVDDDIRNIFALTGALEQFGMNVIHAENGKDGIDMLRSNPDTDLVLMDIMMPDLDGYDTIRFIRGLEEFRELPIIAITAKAMKGDRKKCIEAGASDYIAKPINLEQLLSLFRVWIDH